MSNDDDGRNKDEDHEFADNAEPYFRSATMPDDGNKDTYHEFPDKVESLFKDRSHPDFRVDKDGNVYDLFGKVNSSGASPQQDNNARQGATKDDAYSQAIDRCRAFFERLKTSWNWQYDERTKQIVYEDVFIKALAHAYFLALSPYENPLKAELRIELHKLDRKIKEIIPDKEELKQWKGLAQRELRKLRNKTFDHVDLKDIPDGDWPDATGVGIPKGTSVRNAYLATKRLKYEIFMEEFSQQVCIEIEGERKYFAKESEIYDFLLFRIANAFSFEPKENVLNDAIKQFTLVNKINDRTAFLDQFEPLNDPTYRWQEKIIEILRAETSRLNLETARMMLVGIVERSYNPGCWLRRHISLISNQNLGKSHLCSGASRKYRANHQG
jgi:hypothetical protein